MNKNININLQFDDCPKPNLLSQRGVTAVEMLVAFLLSTILVSLIASMSIRIHHIWKEINYRRVALTELNNQLEQLTRLSLAELPTTLENLQASKACSTVLDIVTLEGELNEDQLGTRITLRINWQRKVPGLPMQLNGWVIERSAIGPVSPTDSAEEIDSNDINNGAGNERAMPLSPNLIPHRLNVWERQI